jgi:DNA-binding HxlR family transcriptional regulator
MKRIADEACMILHQEGRICLFPSEPFLRIIGKKYTILIIGLLGNEKTMSFNKIRKSIGNPRANLLSQRFKEMEELGLIERRVISTRPISVEYSLTEKGARLRENLIPLFRWIEAVSSQYTN